MKLIQIGKAAEMTGLNRQTIRNWINKGILQTRRNGKTVYVNGDVLEKMATTIQEVEATRKALLEEKSRYEQERREYRELMDEMQDKRGISRYYKAATVAAVRSGFFVAVLELMNAYGEITERDAAVLRCLLEGGSYTEVAGLYGISRERARQLAEKAIRRSKCVEDIKYQIDKLHQKDAQILGLQQRIAELLKEKDVGAETYAAEKLAEDRTWQLFQEKLTHPKFGLSVRTLNVLYSSEANIETVGEMVTLCKSDFLKFRNFGRKSLMEIVDLAEKYGLQFGTDMKAYMSEKMEQYREEWYKKHQ